ncbi:hypothetical protein SAY86_019629 [Trapa natans]|uniref:Integrator complex subunit 3 N-terminal domain-containing protein n=1 Tax=Trapa natans TaxID=22666 RepID=A0AAN7LM48_TRANT|nr:hypothetical protein SAY86_019629 [Trapa natans]
MDGSKQVLTVNLFERFAAEDHHVITCMVVGNDAIVLGTTKAILLPWCLTSFELHPMKQRTSWSSSSISPSTQSRRASAPFPLTIPTQEQYKTLNRTILYGILTEVHHAKTHLQHLHAVVFDGYAFFLSFLTPIVSELLEKLVDSARNQVLCVAREMVDVSAIGFHMLLVSLLRQIVRGDLSDGNLCLCFELVSLFLGKWKLLLEEEPTLLASGLYVFLRLLADQCRVSSNNLKLGALVKLEIEFWIKILR